MRGALSFGAQESRQSDRKERRVDRSWIKGRGRVRKGDKGMGTKTGTGDEGKRLERIAKLLEALREAQAREYEIVEEMILVAAGVPTLSQKAAAVVALFGVKWSKAYGSKYQHGGAKDVEAAKRIAKGLEVDDIEGRMERYLADRAPFLRQERHPFALFVSQSNKYAPLKFGESALMLHVAPIGCKHDPPCETDLEHTQRVNRELRS